MDGVAWFFTHDGMFSSHHRVSYNGSGFFEKRVAVELSRGYSKRIDEAEPPV